MARRRKTDVKASVKSSHKYVPVRKSSRQIAKKQLEEKKNGEISQTSCLNNSDDSKSTSEDYSQVPSKKNQNSQKKHSKHKGTSNNIVTISDESTIYDVSQCKRDAGESDSQDDTDNIISKSEKLSPEDVRQVVVGNTDLTNESLSAPVSTEMEVWSEDIIEETIICEEMEVEEDGANLPQDNVMVEEVLLVNETNLESKDFVEFTVIQNEDGTKSMVMTPKSENISNDEYHVIRENVNSVCTSAPENSISMIHTDESSSETCNVIDSNVDRPYINKKKTVLEDKAGKKQKSGKTIYDEIREEISESMSGKVQICSVKDYSDSTIEMLEDNCTWESKDSQTKSVYKDLSKEDTVSKLDNKLADMQISECSKEIQKLVNDLSSMESIDSPVQTPLNVEKLSPVNIDDESSSSILDKMEQLHRPNNSVSPHITDIFSKDMDPNNIIKTQEQDILESNSCNDKIQFTDQVSMKSKIIQDKKNASQQKNTEHLGIIDELQDSEGDINKVDNEDMKLCSSSENSNDTLLSLTNCKTRELDIKNVASNANDIDKRVEFRSRSGSTDTTGSESGSNSSGVRRSSRIRSIGLMKQRCVNYLLLTYKNYRVKLFRLLFAIIIYFNEIVY